MYLVPIHVPIYLDGDRTLVTTEWHRSLVLLRDSFAGRFGTITVAAPTLPAGGNDREQALLEVTPGEEGLRLVPGFALPCRTRSYWTRQRKPWRRQLDALVAEAAVVHSALDDAFRPLAFEGFLSAVRQDKPTVFVQDTDIVLQQRQLTAGQSMPRRMKSWVYGRVYERMCRWAVRRADLSLLKGSALMRRYGADAVNARNFHDTSFSSGDVIAESRLEERLDSLRSDRPVRLVYCGRLVARKGLDHSLRLVAAARASGAGVTFDVIGDGPERAALEAQARSAGLEAVVRFHGPAEYGPELLRRLSDFDALLFTPTAEDTPRMIFDGYAAGLPLLAYDIDYVRERADEEKAAVLLPSAAPDAAADALAGVCRDRERLAGLARAARRAAEYHSAENWYRRRAEWTIDAVERHHARTSVSLPSAGVVKSS